MRHDKAYNWEIGMKVLIADDHALFRDGLSMRLEQIDPKSVIFQAANFTQALKIVNDEKKLDLVILDLDMPDMHWEAGVEEIKKKSDGARFVVISASEDARCIRKTFDAGVSGYIPKRSDPKILNSALQLILDGGTYFPTSILENNNPSAGNVSENNSKGKGKTLTNRQSEVLGFVAKGMSNKQIAYEMGVSEATVKLHINALLRSLGVTNRTQAVVTAQQQGII